MGFSNLLRQHSQQQAYGQRGYNQFGSNRQVGPDMGDLQYMIGQIMSQNMYPPQAKPQLTEDAAPATNPYLDWGGDAPYRSDLSPMGRFLDMGARTQALHANDAAEAQARYARAQAQQAELDKMNAPSGMVIPDESSGQSGAKVLMDARGNIIGSSAAGVRGVMPHGRFMGSDGQYMPFGQVGGLHAGQDGEDPNNVTWQQQQIMEAHKRQKLQDDLSGLTKRLGL